VAFFSRPADDLARAADHLLGPRAHRTLPRPGGEAQNADEKTGTEDGHADNYLPGHADRNIRLGGVEQEQGSDDEGCDPTKPGDAEAGAEMLGHHQGDAE